MPVFLVLVLLEKWYGWYKGMDTVRNMDMISSLSSGITNVTKDVLGLSVAIISYGWMVDKLAITHIESGFWTFFIAFMTLDFSGYWVHRIAHEYNMFWNNHIVHHSSEEYNLACALRQSISVFFRIFTFFLPAGCRSGSTSGSNCNSCTFTFICTVLVSYAAYWQNGFPGKNNCYAFPSSRASCHQSNLS